MFLLKGKESNLILKQNDWLFHNEKEEKHGTKTQFMYRKKAGM